MEERELIDLLMTGWGILCNVSEGDWSEQTEEWQDAVERYRDEVHAVLNEFVQRPS